MKILSCLGIICLSFTLMACGGTSGNNIAVEPQAQESHAYGQPNRAELKQFSHQFLKQKFYSDPTGLVTELNAGGIQSLLNLWEENSRAMGLSETPDAEGLSLFSRPLDNGGGALIVVLPSPDRNGEAYYAAMVLNLRKSDSGDIEGEADYYVLEKSLHNNAHLYLLEEAKRKLKGSDIRPDVDDLWRAIRHQVRQ